MGNINNYDGLKNQVLDNPDSALSSKEIVQLNSISAKQYESMRKDIAEHKVPWQGKEYTLKDFTKMIDANGNVNGKKIPRGTELGGWIQVFLISQGYDVLKQNNNNGLGVDGKIGRFTQKSISAYKGDKKLSETIDKNELDKIKQRLQGAREFSKGRKNPINVTIPNEKEPFKIAVSNYKQTTYVDLNTSTITVDGVSSRFTKMDMQKVDGKINIAPTTANERKLTSIYKYASLINLIFGQVATKKAKSDAPFHMQVGVRNHGLQYESADKRYHVNITGGRGKDLSDVVGATSSEYNALLGRNRKYDKEIGYFDIVPFLNKVYTKKVKEAKIK